MQVRVQRVVEYFIVQKNHLIVKYQCCVRCHFRLSHLNPKTPTNIAFQGILIMPTALVFLVCSQTQSLS